MGLRHAATPVLKQLDVTFVQRRLAKASWKTEGRAGQRPKGPFVPELLRRAGRLLL